LDVYFGTLCARASAATSGHSATDVSNSALPIDSNTPPSGLLDAGRTVITWIGTVAQTAAEASNVPGARNLGRGLTLVGVAFAITDIIIALGSADLLFTGIAIWGGPIGWSAAGYYFTDRLAGDFINFVTDAPQ